MKPKLYRYLVSVLLLLMGSTQVFSQEIQVSGTVLDEQGLSLPGVTVLVKGSSQGTVTDIDGKYTISLTEDGVLVFSFVGFLTQETAVGNRSSIDIVLQEDISSLDEVVVIGYGTQKKSDLTGSVVRVSMDDKSLQSNSNLFQALSGAAAGVNVQGAGLAGGEPNLSIRGQTSLSANDNPLIVVDGIIYNGSIADINTSDVESMDILKDASAAAVYGSRSANGVILITTKKGKSTKPVISFNTYHGVQDMTNNPMRVMNAEEYAVRIVDYYYQQGLYNWYYTKPTSNEGKPVRPDVTNPEVVAARLRTQEERDNYLAGNEIDWVKEVTRLGEIHNYDLSIAQRNDRSNYFISGSYTNEDGILLNDNFERLTLRANLESDITDWLTFGLNTAYTYRDYSGIEASLQSARVASPLANNKIGLPNYDKFLTGEAYMPYPLNNLNIDNSDTRNSIFTVGRLKFTIPWIEGLNYELNYSTTYSNRNNNTFYPVTTPEGSGNKGLATKEPYEERNSILNNIVSYSRVLGDHQINATLLYSRENRKANSSTLTNSGFDNPVLGYNNLGLGTLPMVASTAWEENSISYMARALYTFKDKYLITATVRKDGFSGFSANNKFATFPSLSLGWLISDESFFNSDDTFLKIRASYGKNGNQGIGRYSSFSRIQSNPYVFGTATSIGVYPNVLGNADLGWETTSSVNLGSDFGFFQRRISGAIDVYTSTTSNVLVNRTLPQSSGFQNVWANIGGIDNKGVELQLTTVNMEGKSLNWESNFVFSLNRSEISKLYGNSDDNDIGNSWFVGEPISAIYGYKMVGGLWTEEDLYSGKTLDNWYPGQYKYTDLNNDGVIEPNSDRTIIGYRTPNFRFSIGNSLSYNNFTLSIFINSIQGGNGFYLEDNSSVVNVSWNADDVYRINASAVRPYWTPDNNVNNSTGVYNTPVRQSGVYESRGFVRLQDISLAYKVGPAFLDRLKLNTLQIYVSGKNLYTWTKWSGWDPETGVSNSPLMRSVTAGLRLSL